MKKIIIILMVTLSYTAFASQMLISRVPAQSSRVYVLTDVKILKSALLESPSNPFITAKKDTTCKELAQQFNTVFKKYKNQQENTNYKVYLMMQAVKNLHPKMSEFKITNCVDDSAFSSYAKSSNMTKIFYIKDRGKNFYPNITKVKAYKSIESCKNSHKTGCAVVINANTIVLSTMKATKNHTTPFSDIKSKTDLMIALSAMMAPILMDVGYGYISRKAMTNLIGTASAFK